MNKWTDEDISRKFASLKKQITQMKTEIDFIKKKQDEFTINLIVGLVTMVIGILYLLHLIG